MCSVSVSDFRKKIKEYLTTCSKEKVFITSNGKIVAVLSNPDELYYQSLVSLCGCLKDNDKGEDYKEMIGEEIMKKCGY